MHLYLDVPAFRTSLSISSGSGRWCLMGVFKEQGLGLRVQGSVGLLNSRFRIYDHANVYRE